MDRNTRSPLKISARRLRGALVAALSALATTAIAAPASAGAAEEAPAGLTVSCVPPTLGTGALANCLATVSSPGGAPTGGIRWFVTGGYLDMDDGPCELKPMSAKASSCSMSITGYVGGQASVTAGYFPQSANQAKATDTQTVTFQGGSLQVECSPQPSVSKDPVECEAHVPGAASGTVPRGDVAFRAISRFGSQQQQIEPECTLKPAPGGASCFVTYTPVFAEGTVDGGRSAVLAEYEGDAAHPAEDGNGFVEVARYREVSMLASCEYEAPVVLTSFNCVTTVENVSPSGDAPTGQLTVFNEGGIFTGRFPKGRTCVLKPVLGEPKVSSCAVAFEPIVLGAQRLEVTYDAEGSFEPTFKGLSFDVIEGIKTVTTLNCEDVPTDQVGTCIARVFQPGPPPNPLTPEGTVFFQPLPSGPPLQLSSFSCQLQRLALDASRCVIHYRSAKAGSWTFHATYGGSSVTAHAASKATTTVTIKDSVNAPQ